MISKVKQYIHRGLMVSIPGGYVKAVMRKGHFNEDGKWMPFAYLLHYYHLKEEYPYEMESFYKIALLVDRMEAVAGVDEWVPL